MQQVIFGKQLQLPAEPIIILPELVKPQDVSESSAEPKSDVTPANGFAELLLSTSPKEKDHSLISLKSTEDQ